MLSVTDGSSLSNWSESELLLLVQLGLRRQSQRSSWGKRRSSDQSSGFRYDAVLPPSDPSSFTFPLWFIRSAGGTEKLQKYLTTFKFSFLNTFFNPLFKNFLISLFKNFLIPFFNNFLIPSLLSSSGSGCQIGRGLALREQSRGKCGATRYFL